MSNTSEEFTLDNIHITAPLASSAVNDQQHLPLQPLLCKLWIACHVLELGQETSFTALVLLHRYYASHQPEETQDWKWIGAACLVLSMKAEEEIRRLRDVINVAHMFDFSLEKSTDLVFDIPSHPPELDEDYWKAKESIVSTEQMVLRVLTFDVQVSHPHRLVVLLAQDLGLSDDVVKSAWMYLNGALFYTPALTQNALSMACAALELVIKRGPDKYFGGIGDLKRSMVNLKAATQHLQKMRCAEHIGQSISTSSSNT